MKIYIYFILLFSFLIASNCFAQGANEIDNLDDEYKNIALPPLSVLFENAKQTSDYELVQLQEEIQRQILSKERKSFLSFFTLRGSYQYGMFGNESTYTDVAITPYLTYSTQAQKGYTVGGGLIIPLDQLFDLSAKVKRQKLNIKKAELEKLVKYDEIQKNIIDLYVDANFLLKVLKMQAEALLLAKVQYEISEKNFINATINSTELSVEKGKYALAFENYEKTKSEIAKKLLMLELISHTTILRKK